MKSGPKNYPVYMVIYRPIYGDMVAQRYGIRQLVRVIACDVKDIDAVWQREIAPHQNTQEMPPLGVEYFTREPLGVLRELAEPDEGDGSEREEEGPA